MGLKPALGTGRAPVPKYAWQADKDMQGTWIMLQLPTCRNITISSMKLILVLVLHLFHPKVGFFSAACNCLFTYLSLVQFTYMVKKYRLLTVLDMKSPSFRTFSAFQKIAFQKNILSDTFLRIRRMGNFHLLYFSIFTFIFWPDLGKVKTLSVQILRIRGKNAYLLPKRQLLECLT